MKTHHYPFLDLIRVVACFLVIVLHVAAINFPVFSDTWMINVFWDGISRMCVPLFFMISGFLFLDKQIDCLWSFYFKRYIRILIPFFVICLFYFFTPEYSDYSFIKYLIHISIINFADYHLWYIYALIPTYLTLPFFMKIFSKKSHIKYVKAYLIIWSMVCIVGNTLLCYLMPEIRRDFVIFTTNLYYFYVLMGYLIFGFMGYLLCGMLIKKTYANYGGKFFLVNLLIFILANTAIVYFTWSHSHATGQPNELFFENLTPFVVCQSVSFFILCTYAQRERKGLRSLADKTFWIYLLHLLWLRFLLSLLPLPTDESLAIAIPAFSMLVFVMAWLTSIPLRSLEVWLLRACPWAASLPH